MKYLCLKMAHYILTNNDSDVTCADLGSTIYCQVVWIARGDVVFCRLCCNLHDMVGDTNSQRREVSSVYTAIQAVH